MGVKNLKIKGITIRDQRTFAGMFRNWEHVVCEDVFIDLPHKKAQKIRTDFISTDPVST